MNIPDSITCFDVLYSLASADGRGDALFGDSIVYAGKVVERSLIGSSIPSFYLEFPLLGRPCFDILTVYDKVDPGACFAEGAGYGYQKMFDWFSHLPESHGASCAIEVDTGSGETECAGVYMQQRRRKDLVAPFLESVGEDARAGSYLKFMERLPQGMSAAYAGLFPGREGSPMRIGGYMDKAFIDNASDDTSVLDRAFSSVGFGDHDPGMLELCSRLLAMSPAADYQFDIYPDGSVGDVFGLSLSFNDVLPNEAAECMNSGFGKDIMTTIQDLGLADDRWKMIAGASMGKGITVKKTDGREVFLVFAIRLNYVKIKFKAGVPVFSKFYLILQAAEMNR